MTRPVYSLTITDPALDYLDRLTLGIETMAYGKAVGEAGVVAVQRRLSEKNVDRESHSTARRLGATPSGLFADMARSIGYGFMTSRDGVVISINHVAASQRFHGGRIEPSAGKTYLTIPAIAEAYGVRAPDAPVGLTPMIRRDPATGTARAVALQEDNTGPSRGKKKAQPGRVWYWLVESVEQRGDPKMLPDDDVLAAAVSDAIATWFEEV